MEAAAERGEPVSDPLEPGAALGGLRIEPLAVVDDLEDEDPFDCVSRTVAADASAYFATFCSASRQEK